MRAPKPYVFNEDDPYLILGLSPSATQVELKAAYRNLAKKYHPDAGGDEKRILQLNAAWELVGDIDKRIAYDKQRQYSKFLHNNHIYNAYDLSKQDDKWILDHFSVNGLKTVHELRGIKCTCA